MRITRASDTRSDSDDRRTLIRLPHPSLANDSAESQSSTTDSTFTDKILRLFGRFVCAGYLFYLLILIPNIRDRSGNHRGLVDTCGHLRDIRNSHGVGTFDVPAPDNLDSSSCRN